MLSAVAFCVAFIAYSAAVGENHVHKRGVVKFDDGHRVEHGFVKTVTITKQVPVPYPFEVQKKVPVPIKVLVEKPYPVFINRPFPMKTSKIVAIPAKVPVPNLYPAEKEEKVPETALTEKLLPYTPYSVYVGEKIAYKIEKPVHGIYTIEKPVSFQVPFEKQVTYPVEKEVTIPYKVPVQVFKHVPSYYNPEGHVDGQASGEQGERSLPPSLTYGLSSFDYGTSLYTPSYNWRKDTDAGSGDNDQNSGYGSQKSQEYLAEASYSHAAGSSYSHGQASSYSSHVNH